MPANRKAAQEAKAMKMWDALEGEPGRTDKIATKLKVHPVTVVKWARKNGKKVVYPFNRPARLDYKEIFRLRKKRNGRGGPLFTHREIAEICECSKSAITKVLTDERQRYLDEGEVPPAWI